MMCVTTDEMSVWGMINTSKNVYLLVKTYFALIDGVSAVNTLVWICCRDITCTLKAAHFHTKEFV